MENKEGRIDGKRVKEARDKLGLTQTELAKLSGVSQGQLSEIESSSSTNARVGTLASLASALGVDPSELLAPAAPDAEKRLPLTRGGKPVDIPVAPVRVTPAKLASVPVLGVVPGGPLMLVEQSTEAEMVAVPPEVLIYAPRAFAVRVSGTSMEPLIQHGDYAIADPDTGWKDGSTVIAQIDGDVTIKRIGRINGDLALVPINDGHDPIILGEQQVHIQAVVISAIRHIEIPR